MTAMLSVQIGTRVRTNFAATDLVTGNLADSGVVVLTIERPDETTQLVYLNTGIQHPSVGMYYFDITTDQVGVWHVSWAGSGSGPNVTAGGVFKVDSTGID